MIVRAIVSGSRDWPDYELVSRHLDPLLSWKPDLTIVHGGARGVDQMAGRWASNWGVRTEVWPAEWDKLGKRAGIVRNLKMAEAGADVVIAFPSTIPPTPGTGHMMATADKLGIPLYVVTTDGHGNFAALRNDLDLAPTRGAGVAGNTGPLTGPHDGFESRALHSTRGTGADGQHGGV